MSRSPRLPLTITFSPSYKVAVKQVADEIMDVAYSDADAVWVVENRSILIRRKLPSTRKWYLLTHELAHALADFQHYLIDAGIAKS